MANNVLPDPLNVDVVAGFQKSAYGELISAGLEPEVQVSAQYNTFVDVTTVALGTASAVAEGGEFVATAGVGAADFVAIFSDSQIVSRPGQGSLARFTARFDVGLPLSRISAGVTSAADGLSFGYVEDVFGISYFHGGLSSINELQITTPAGGSENATVTLDGVGFTVPLTSGTVEQNALEIADSLSAQALLYSSSQNGDTVIIRSIFAQALTGSFTFSSSTAAGTFTEIEEGLLPTDEFVARADWNVDIKSDLDPQKINNYSIRWNGSIEYFVQDSATGDDVLVHIFSITNTRTEPMFGINTFRIGWDAFNFGNTTPVSVRGTRGAAFNEGKRVLTSSTRADLNSLLGVGTSLVNVITIKCRDVFGNKTNLGMIEPLSANIASTGNNKNAIVEIIRNADLTGGLDADYQYHDKASSITQINKIACDVSGGETAGLFVLTPDSVRLIEGPAVTAV